MRKLMSALAIMLFLVGGLNLLPSTANAFDEIELEAGVKKGHWTRNCDCKWPGQECNRP
ncbi:MAG: hypothetical protein HC892_22440 [Saprospiraceae bacterium]|nr:hypothetical protein [Saprospiraceae bacterium]